MFRRKKRKIKFAVYDDGSMIHKDPIAAKLHEACKPEPGKPDVPTYTTEEWEALQGQESLTTRNAKWAAIQPEAKYETLEFVSSDDDKVLNFLSELGYDPKTIEKGTITFEAGRPLVLDLKVYALDKVTYGSAYNPWDVKR